MGQVITWQLGPAKWVNLLVPEHFLEKIKKKKNCVKLASFVKIAFIVPADTSAIVTVSNITTRCLIYMIAADNTEPHWYIRTFN